MIMSMLIAPVVLLLGAVEANATQDTDQQTENGVVTVGNGLNSRPDAGTVILRPALSSTSPDPTRVINVELVFAAIDKTPSGELIPRADVEERTYTVGIGRSYRGQDKVQSFDDYHTRTINLPSGTYTLSEVHYFAEDIALGGRPDVNVTYCLSDRSFTFDVGSGEVVSLGGVAIADLPRNRGQYSRHHPVAGIDMASALTASSNTSDAFSLAQIVDTAFEQESGICGDTRFNVAGW